MRTETHFILSTVTLSDLPIPITCKSRSWEKKSRKIRILGPQTNLKIKAQENLNIRTSNQAKEKGPGNEVEMNQPNDVFVYLIIAIKLACEHAHLWVGYRGQSSWRAEWGEELILFLAGFAGSRFFVPYPNKWACSQATIKPPFSLPLHIMKKVKVKSGAYPGFCSMKRLRVFLIGPGWDASPSQGYPQH